MTDLLEKRQGDLETLVWELPSMLTLRLGRFETAISDNTGRLAAIERALATMQIDVRDLRGGVTRQLTGQDQRLGEIESRLGHVGSRLDQVGSELVTIKDAVAGNAAQLTRLETILTEVAQRLP